MPQTKNKVDRRSFITAAAAVATLSTIGFNRTSKAQGTTNLYTQIVRMRIKPGKEAEAMALQAEMMAIQEERSEHLLISYVHRLEDDPLQINTFQVFTDREKAMATGSANYMLPFYSRLGEVYEDGTELIALKREMGFTR